MKRARARADRRVKRKAWGDAYRSVACRHFARQKKTLPTFGAHRGGCEMSASIGSVAVGLMQAPLADALRT